MFPFTLTLVDDTVIENAGFATAVITPSGVLPDEVVISVSTNPLSAIGIYDLFLKKIVNFCYSVLCYLPFNAAPNDYTATTTTLTFPAGTSAPQSVPIPITNDDVVENDETFNVQASSTDSRVTINGSPVGTVTATIIDDDRKCMQ